MTFFAKELPPDKNEQITIISYFGNRDLLIPDLLKILKGKKYSCLYEPFAGSAAISFAAMKEKLASNYVINDTLTVFECLWKFVKHYPQELISTYYNLVKQYALVGKVKKAEIYSDLLEQFNQQFKYEMISSIA